MATRICLCVNVIFMCTNIIFYLCMYSFLIFYCLLLNRYIIVEDVNYISASINFKNIFSLSEMFPYKYILKRKAISIVIMFAT